MQTRDVFHAAMFYGDVLDWALEAIDILYRGDHVLVTLKGRVVRSLQGGSVRTAPQPHLRPRWLVSFVVDDMEQAVSAAMRAGGERPRPSSTWTPEGFSRVLQDPEGRLFSLAHRET
ncbi:MULTISPECIES: VOC family protein [Streptomyces]|uniref:VOC family protein n=1 Tax=Streptomyces TaxID=1883 RepID=UPI00227718EF|nr:MULTISPECIES: VOC family protein [Streptomyces]MDX2917175.1 hypothetical protein [Streptomyces sp. NE06-03C]